MYLHIPKIVTEIIDKGVINEKDIFIYTIILELEYSRSEG